MMRIGEGYTAGGCPPATSLRCDDVHTRAVEVFFGDVSPARRKLLSPDAVLPYEFLVRDDAEPGFLDQPQVNRRGLPVDHERSLPEGDFPEPVGTGPVTVPSGGESVRLE